MPRYKAHYSKSRYYLRCLVVDWCLGKWCSRRSLSSLIPAISKVRTSDDESTKKDEWHNLPTMKMWEKSVSWFITSFSTLESSHLRFCRNGVYSRRLHSVDTFPIDWANHHKSHDKVKCVSLVRCRTIRMKKWDVIFERKWNIKILLKMTWNFNSMPYTAHSHWQGSRWRWIMVERVFLLEQSSPEVGDGERAQVMNPTKYNRNRNHNLIFGSFLRLLSAWRSKTRHQTVLRWYSNI